MMKKLSKIALLAAASAFMLAVFPACGDDDDGDDDPSVKITGGTSVTVGGTALDLTATVSNFPESVTYDWASSAEDVAMVAADSDDPSKATVTPVAEGTATITVTATVGDTVATADVTVTVAAEGSTPPSQTENYTLNIENLTTLGNVKESSRDFDTTVTKIWAVAANKSIQGFANGTPPFIKMTGGGANVNANAEYGLQVKISAAATITITALSKQGKSANQ